MFKRILLTTVLSLGVFLPCSISFAGDQNIVDHVAELWRRASPVGKVMMLPSIVLIPIIVPVPQDSTKGQTNGNVKNIDRNNNQSR